MRPSPALLATLLSCLLLAPFLAGSASASEWEDVCRPDPRCDALCWAKARDVRQACLDAGRTRHECRRVAREHREACSVSECSPTLPCEARCKVHAKRLLQECLEAGEHEERCREDSRMAFDRCVERNCEDCGCPPVYEPVCGRDGMTYASICKAECAGVHVVSNGPCERQCPPVYCPGPCPHGTVEDEYGCGTCECKPRPGCESDAECRDDETCRKICPLAPCRFDLKTGESFCPPCTGVCVPRPIVCPPAVCPAFCPGGQTAGLVSTPDGCRVCDCIEPPVAGGFPGGAVIEIAPTP